MGGQPESPSSAARGAAVTRPKRISGHYSGLFLEAVFSYEPKYVQSMYICIGTTQASKRRLKTDSIETHELF